MRPRLIRASYFVWMLAALAGWAAYEHSGLPHIIWTYSYRGGETSFSSRYYTRCTFVGPYGAFTVPAERGRCAWIAFFRQEMKQ
jgi:hypothetical protein